MLPTIGDMPEGIHTGIEPLRKEARLFGPALCQLLSNHAEEPTQASTTRHVRSGPCQLVVLLPASCSAFDWHRFGCSLRMSRYRLSTFFCFWCFRPARNYDPGQASWNQDGKINGHESPFFPFAEGPTGPRTNLRRDTIGLLEPVQVGLF